MYNLNNKINNDDRGLKIIIMIINRLESIIKKKNHIGIKSFLKHTS